MGEKKRKIRGRVWRRRHATAGRRFVSTKSASTQKLHAFANLRRRKQKLIALSSGGYAGAFRSAALQELTKTQDLADGCVFGNCKQFLRRCSTSLVQLRHAVVSTASAHCICGIRYALCHWLRWYLLTPSKAARLRTHPALRREKFKVVVTALPSLAAAETNAPWSQLKKIVKYTSPFLISPFAGDDG